MDTPLIPDIQTYVDSVNAMWWTSVENMDTPSIMA
jgi:hypothetical protein